MGSGDNLIKLKSSTGEKDIGVIVDSQLSFEKHIHAKVNKANSIMSIIRRTYCHLDNKSFCLLFKALVRPHLEYCNSVWKPHKVKDIEMIENVQRRATKMLPGCKGLEYEDRLKELGLPTLALRRERGDMIECYKILHGVYDSKVSGGILKLHEGSRTRGHSFRLYKDRFSLPARKQFCSKGSEHLEFPA